MDPCREELAEIETQIQRLEALLSSEFSEKAPDKVVAKERSKLEGFRETQHKLNAQIKDLG